MTPVRSSSRARRPVSDDRTIMLDIRDVAMLTSSDEIEELPDAWLESDEPTAVDFDQEQTRIDVFDEPDDDDGDRELADLVASLTAELCERPRRPMRRPQPQRRR